MRRNVKYLRDRSGLLLGVSGIGLLIGYISGPWFRAFEGEYNCVIYTMSQLSFFPLFLWPLVVRILVWRNQIRFNYFIAKQVAENGLYEINVDDPLFKKARWPASREFAFALTFGILGLHILVAFLVAVFGTCAICDVEAAQPIYYVYFLSTSGSIILLVIWILYNYRDVPDTIKIYRETLHSLMIGASIAFPGLILESADAGGFLMREDSPFTWGVLIELGLFLVFVYTVPVQVYRSYNIENQSSDEEDFVKILASKRGLRYFRLYLATEFSLENILFYQTALKFIEDFNSPDSQKVGRQIIQTYFTPGALFEVNVGGVIREDLTQYLKDPNLKIEQTTFKRAIAETFRIMYTNSFENFKRSDFYKLYKGEIDPNGSIIIRSTGMTSFKLIEDEHIAS